MSAGSATQFLQPLEALAAHAGRQDGNAAAAENARDRDAAAAIVAGRGPHGLVDGGIELAGDEARHETGIGRRAPCARRSSGSGTPSSTTIGASTPVSTCGSTTWPGTSTTPDRSARRCTSARARDFRDAGRRERPSGCYAALPCGQGARALGRWAGTRSLAATAPRPSALRRDRRFASRSASSHPHYAAAIGPLCIIRDTIYRTIGLPPRRTCKVSSSRAVSG